MSTTSWRQFMTRKQSMARKYKTNKKTRPKKKQPTPEIPEEEQEWEIEKLIDSRRVKNQLEYFVKWEGWPSSTNTWEKASNLPQKVIDEFEQRSQDFTPASSVSDSDDDEETESLPPRPVTPNRSSRRRIQSPVTPEDRLIDTDDSISEDVSHESSPIFSDNGDHRSPSPILINDSGEDDFDPRDDEDVDLPPPLPVGLPREIDSPVAKVVQEESPQKEEEDEDAEDNQYEVEKIVAYRAARKAPKKKNGKRMREFQVKWKGWDNSFNSWLHEIDCCCPKLIEEFERAEQEKKTKTKPVAKTKAPDAQPPEELRRSKRKRGLTDKPMPDKKRARRTLPGPPPAKKSAVDKWNEWAESASFEEFKEIFQNAPNKLSSQQITNVADALGIPLGQ